MSIVTVLGLVVVGGIHRSLVSYRTLAPALRKVAAFACPEDGKQYRHKRSLIRHTQSHQDHLWVCRGCARRSPLGMPEQSQRRQRLEGSSRRLTAGVATPSTRRAGARSVRPVCGCQLVRPISTDAGAIAQPKGAHHSRRLRAWRFVFGSDGPCARKNYP